MSCLRFFDLLFYLTFDLTFTDDEVNGNQSSSEGEEDDFWNESDSGNEDADGLGSDKEMDVST